MSKKLYRSRRDRKLAGVIGGLADYSGMDPSLLRVIFVLLLIFTGLMPMALIYAVCAFVIPNDSGALDE